MDVRKTLQPGQHGTRRWLNTYGDKLVNVRYRYDNKNKRRYTTVEIIVEEKPYHRCEHYWEISAATKPGERKHPKNNPSAPKQNTTATTETNDAVYVRITYTETEQRIQIKAAGGYWDKEKRLWKISRQTARALGMEERIIKNA